jgi:hypothetical protein
MPWDTIIATLFGAGGAGALAGIANIVKSRQKGKIEREETLIARLDASNKHHQDRADAAEKEAAEERVKAYKALEKAARLKALLLQHGIDTDIQVWDD